MFDLLFLIVPFLIICTFIYVFVMIISPKARGKIMSRQIKATKYMVDESKDDIESISTNMANATKKGIMTTASAMASGFKNNENMYCKHCGSQIDTDSKYCKHCGKKQ